MNPTNTAAPSPSPSPSLNLSSRWSSLMANRYTLPAITVVLGFVIGIALMAAVTPKPETYTRPLQAQVTSLQQQERYGRVMALNYTILDVHYNQLVTDLDANSVSGSEADATRLATSTQTYINDLKKLTVPACLKATNTALLAGLTDIQQSAAALDKALVANDSGQASADGEQMSRGLDQVTTAENDYAAAAC